MPDWRGSDLVAQAMGGMLALSGHPDRPPLRSLGLQAYHQASVLAATRYGPCWPKGVINATVRRGCRARRP